MARDTSGIARVRVLSAAELRVLPLLCTHLSSAEIAAELFVSLHTVRSHQAPLHRKPGAPSHSQAVTRARQLGLLEGKWQVVSSHPGGCRRGRARGGMEARRRAEAV